MNNPFDIFFDEEDSKYYLFFPDGAVLVDGVNCVCDERDQFLNVPLDFGVDDLPSSVYGHVVVTYSGEGDSRTVESRKVSFDGNSTKTASDNQIVFNFIVSSFGDEDNDGMQYDVCTSAISFSTASSSPSVVSSIPRPFDIEDGKVVRCSIPCPVSIISCLDYEIDTSIDGEIWLHIDRVTDGYSISVDQESRDNSYSHIQYKLYEIENGVVKLDTRPSVIPVFDI